MTKKVTKDEQELIAMEPCYYVQRGNYCAIKNEVCRYAGYGRFHCSIFYGITVKQNDLRAMKDSEK